tara:strand:- start:14362 stop:15393 length:1032 start_codon:yes stop_codon:yes gene_type:complete
MKEKFREIYDEQDLYDNLRFDIKFTRVFIRYAVRIFGISNSILILKLILKFTSFNKDFSYHAYLLKTNLYRLEYFLELSSEDYLESFRIKKKWAKYIINQSPSKKAIANAKNYHKIISMDSIDKVESKEISKSNLKKFYIYGPSSQNNPLEKYNDYTLVHLKPFPKELKFNDEILFLNSFYFTNAVNGNKNLQEKFNERYKKVYVSCMTSDMPSDFIRIPLVNEGYLASEMALQRILKFLIEKHENIECVIEGFDFYLSEDAYQNKNYDKLTRKQSGIDEKEICLSIAEHDFYFNFMITKQFMHNIRLIDSYDFQKIISMSPSQYCRELFRVRNFRSIKNIIR